MMEGEISRVFSADKLLLSSGCLIHICPSKRLGLVTWAKSSPQISAFTQQNKRSTRFALSHKKITASNFLLDLRHRAGIESRRFFSDPKISKEIQCRSFVRSPACLTLGFFPRGPVDEAIRQTV